MMRTVSEQQIFAIYSRKSKFTGKGESIENQIEMCRQYISRNFGQEQSEGTEYCKVDGRKRKTFHLKFTPEESKLVQMIFTKFLPVRLEGPETRLALDIWVQGGTFKTFCA